MVKGGQSVTLANHKSIVPKTVQSIFSQAGVSVEEFIGAL
jgi:hypothetical protein